MKPEIIVLPSLTIAGMSFYGDPLGNYSAWMEENEIGCLWKRLGSFLSSHSDISNYTADALYSYEIHCWNKETMQTGKYEVFAGYEIPMHEYLHAEILYKIIPAAEYACFTLGTEDMSEDIFFKITSEWLPEAGLDQMGPFSLNRYYPQNKEKFDVLIPVRFIQE